MSERQDIEAMQDNLNALKDGLKTIMTLNTEAGRDKEANAVFGLLADLNKWHAKATKKLHKLYPEFASQIQTRGVGR